MKLGLVRHFKIYAPMNKIFMSSEDFNAWAKEYEASGVEKVAEITPFSEWGRCFCSSSVRTVQTANLLYDGFIEKTDLIREVPIAPVFQTRMKLPLFFWLVAGRLAWLFSHKSQPESFSETVQRVKKFVKHLLSTNDAEILIVSHGFIMQIIRRQLLINGFVGEKFIKVRHGRLYVYEK